jgi:signal transduction histidine kinase
VLVSAVIRPLSPARQSVLIAAICFAVDAADLFDTVGDHGPSLVTRFLFVLVLDGALALPAQWSGWVALGFVVTNVATTMIINDAHAASAGTLIVAYRAGAWLVGRPAVLSLLLLCAGSIGTNLAVRMTSPMREVLCCGPIHEPPLMVVVSTVLIDTAASAVLPWMVGRVNTAHRAYLDELRHRQETDRHEAQDAVERAVVRERTAIARDLHDVISHHVSATGMHAGAARLALTDRSRTGPVADSLAAVETASRAAMADLRKMLDVLHGTSDDAAQPGLDNLDELLDGVRRSGLPVRFAVHGPARPLSGSLDLALYRIAQEMLTNARRHGDGGPVELTLTYASDAVTLAAGNGIGPAAAEPGTARGLAGIRTRSAMFQGSVTYGPDAGGRWETSVTVPTTEAQ